MPRLIGNAGCRKLSALGLALGAVVLLAGCSGKTTGATNVTTTSARLNASGSCDNPNCSAYIRWRKVGTTTWTNGPTISGIGKVSNVPWAETATGLAAGVQYEYQACGKEASFGSTFVCVGPDGGTTSTQKFTTVTTGTPPDMRIEVPTNAISTGLDPDTGHRMLRFTHVTWDAGPGPFELDPTYDPRTGTATFVQSIYNMPSPGNWVLDHTVPVPVVGVYDPPDDYQFPLTSFALRAVNQDGSLGATIATSPKTDYCITGDAYVGGVPNAPNQTTPPPSNCVDPTKPLGWSVGWGDQYDQTDSGQPIDLTGVADGTYVLRAIADPQHVLTEANRTNNVTDTKIRISGSSVTVLGQSSPTITPPEVAVTSPAPGSTVTGTVNLHASASASAPATVTSVQFLLDGQPLGSPITGSPYTKPWVVGSVAPGSHTLSARVTDSTGSIGTARAITVTVPPGSGGGGGSPAIDRSVTASGRGTQTAAISTIAPGETLLAFVSADGPSGGGQTATVSGAGLNWSLVRRANTRTGDSEIWKATATGTLSNASVASTPGQSGFDQQLTVLSFANAGGTGASAAASGVSGPPAVGLTATAPGSFSYAVGNDWDRAVARAPGPGQSLISQLIDSGSGDTFWVQGTTAPSQSAGSAVTLNDTSPTDDQWNLAATEVVPAAAPADTTPPKVSIINPTASQTVSGTIPVAASATDDVAVKSVDFMLDGRLLGSSAPAAPHATTWDTTTVADGSHELTAVATDTSGNTTTATTVPVRVQNPPPPMTCFVLQAQVSAHGRGTVTSPAFHTAVSGETILAFVGTDGPAGAGRQTATVRGGGLSWKLVRRANARSGDAEIWAATAPGVLTNATVRSTPLRGGYDQDLTVIAMEGTTGVGASASGSGPSGAPSVRLTTTAPTSLVFAVGNDGDRARARTLPEGWVSLEHWADAGSGNTFWSQYTNQPVPNAGTKVTVADTAPRGDQWNLAAVELPGAE